MINVLLHGACGHMGKEVAAAVKENENLAIVAGVDAFGDAYEDFPIYRSLDEVREKADVIIDFSTAKAVDGLLAFVNKTKMPVVLCTTGLSDEQVEAVKKTSETVPVLRSGNMSLGINLMLKLLKIMSGALVPNGFDPEIVEMHHKRKLDAPSGTAVMLADAVNEGQGGDMHYVYNRSDRREARDAEELGISSVRGGTIPGIHDVIFAGPDEVIEIKHTAYSRGIFAKGAASAAIFLAYKPAGLYDMGDVIDEAAQ
ncbi:MAG: 4-hydroxy-tetrahydrodipicolinate reductase [Lachnospiraceae bacterium]|nr:4-hydroxy-tetrahydrodipicolinate reductase [Lachnospiraceae bacterium]